MFIGNTRLWVVLVAVALALPVQVSAAECLTTLEATNTEDVAETGYATLIQADQGQGTIDCSAFSGPGGMMVPVPGGVTTPVNSIGWSITSTDPEIHADLIFASSSSGARCTQQYAGNARSGNATAGTKKRGVTILACTDGDLEELPPEPLEAPTPPLTTIGSECTGDTLGVIQGAIDGSLLYDWVIVGGRDTTTAGGEGNTAICVDQENNVVDGLLPTDDLMARCVERCITPLNTSRVPWFPLDADPQRQAGGICTGNGDENGRFPIECRVCELTSEVASDIYQPDLEFCWELEQRADVPGGEPVPLQNGSFTLPPPFQGEQSWTVRGSHGSQCYTFVGQTQTGEYYTFKYPAGCRD
jgi:hypothetical protein